MKLPSGGSLNKALAALRDGDTLELASGGVYEGTSLYDHPTKVVIRGNGATIRSHASALKFERVPYLDLSDLILTESNLGLVITQCGGFEVRGVQASKNRITGILTANTSNGLIDDCECSHNRQQHGIYLSQSGDHLRVINCRCDGNGRAGVQVNAVEDHPNASDPNRDSLSHDVEISGCSMDGNQNQGGAAINLAGVVLGNVLNNRIIGHLGHMGIALFDDGAGPEYACKDVGIDGNSFAFASTSKPRACISIGKGCTDISIGTGNHFAPGVIATERQ